MKTLQELVGETVEIKAGYDCSDSNGIHFSFFGKLEGPEDGLERYYVRVRDDGYGAQGVGFHPDQVSEIRKLTYHYQIELKQVLNAPID